MVTRSHGLFERLLSDLRARKADSLIPRDLREGKILDIGCGTYPNFLDQTSFQEKTGIDQTVTNETAIIGSRKDLIRLLPFTMEPGKSLPFENGTFSVISLLAVLEHLDRPTAVELLKECRRTLKEKGLIILTVPAGWTDGLLKRLAELGLVSSVEIEDHKQKLTRRDVFHLLCDSGFTASQCTVGTFEFFINIWATAKKTASTTTC